MTVVVKDKSADLVVPRRIRKQAGIKTGDLLEFKVSGGIINIIPKLAKADAEYTPSQRSWVGAQLEEAAKGPYYGPFETAGEAMRFANQEIRKRDRSKAKATKR